MRQDGGDEGLVFSLPALFSGLVSIYIGQRVTEGCGETGWR